MKSYQEGNLISEFSLFANRHAHYLATSLWQRSQTFKRWTYQQFILDMDQTMRLLRLHLTPESLQISPMVPLFNNLN